MENKDRMYVERRKEAKKATKKNQQRKVNKANR